MKLLLFDLENSPHQVYSWGTWQQNISASQIIVPSTVLCWACKWVDKDGVIFDWHGDKALKRLHRLLSEADAVITYNGKRHDIPIINREFLAAGLAPPEDYAHIDLYQVAKGRFKLASNKLAYILEFLKLPSKLSNSGFKLWPAVMKGDRSARAEMREYCCGDVWPGLEALYKKLRPWIKNHPNLNRYNSGVNGCSKCGAPYQQLEMRGFYRTDAGKYQRYKCSSCGGWSTSRQRQENIVALKP